MTTVRLYHGTNQVFDAFKVDSSLSGAATNSALGVHLTSSPALAAEYGARTSHPNWRKARVAVVDVEISALCVFMDRYDYLELDPVDTFEELTRLGYDGVAADVDGDSELTGACVILDPEKVRIVEFISADEAYEIEENEGPKKDVWDGVQLTVWPPSPSPSP